MAAFTARLTFACFNKDLLKQMGATARDRSEEYNIERTTKIMLGHYRRLTETTKPLKKSLDERLIAVLEEFLK
jgi:hypothetical protein